MQSRLPLEQRHLKAFLVEIEHDYQKDPPKPCAYTLRIAIPGWSSPPFPEADKYNFELLPEQLDDLLQKLNNAKALFAKKMRDRK